MQMAKRTILVIDDERYFLLLTKEMLEEEGYMVIAADDVDEGVKLFYEKKPDMLVMDIVMPKEFGTEICKDLKETDQGKRTPIILMSSGVKEMSEGEGLEEYKADEYILKPFDKHVFIGLLKKHLERDQTVTVSFDKKELEQTQREKLDLDLFDLKDIKPYSGSGKPKSVDFSQKSYSKENLVQIEQGEGGLNIKISVEQRTAGIFLANTMINVNNGGIFVTSDFPAPLGSKIDLRLKCNLEEISLKGMIVWVQPANLKTSQQSGMGIRFHDQKAEGIAKLRSYIDSIKS